MKPSQSPQRCVVILSSRLRLSVFRIHESSYSVTPSRLRRALAFASLPLALATSFTVFAQQINDPANLAGERVSAPDLADSLPIDHGALALQQLLRKLRTRASFMLIVAHPDDEDGGMLTYLSRGQGARVATLTLNRGEGGQNLMSADFGDALGLIRTQELLAADRYMGVDQFFGTEVDFGFSKTKEEAFGKWSHERVLYDAVRAIRLYRPLVIASVFIGAPSDGHGQHQVSGEIAQEAFKAAGNPNVFPDQIAAGLQPWQPLKVYARSPFARIDAQGMFDYAISEYVPPRFTNYVTGTVTETVPKANVVVPEGTPDPLLGGLSYVQFARKGLALQKSQIGASFRPAPAARMDVSYHRYGSKLNQPDGDDSGLETSFFDGIDTTLPGIATLAPSAPPKLRAVLMLIDLKIDEAQKQFNPANPAAIAEPLRLALQSLVTVISGTEAAALNPAEKFNLLHELRIKRVQLNNALLLADGVTLEASLTDPAAGHPLLTTDHHIAVRTTLSHNSTDSVTLTGIALHLPQTPWHFPASQNRLPIPQSSPRTDTIVADFHSGLPPTRPYFSRPGIEQPYYDIAEPALRDAPATSAPFAALATLDDHGVSLEIAATVSNRAATIGTANASAPLVVVPPISVSVSPSLGILTPKQQSANVTAEVTTDSLATISGTVALHLPPGKNIASAQPNFTLAKPGEAATVGFTLDSPDIANHSHTLTAIAKEDGRTYSEGYRPVGYLGLTPTNYYTPATFKAVAIDVHTAPHLSIAYLPGTGDDIPAALDDLGIHVHILTLADLTAETLHPYDAIILGVRAYTAHPELAGTGSQPLLDYARSGGIVIVQFNNGRYGDAEAPFPITVASSSGDHSHDVIDETSQVHILASESPFLTWPNRITTADFDNWVEERGHSFAGSWAPRYQALLETHDPLQEPQRGGLLVAPTGKGYYIYCGLALYRQFPEGVPGAYRLLANLISAAKNPALQK
jgi:LmbE family N-acetylglucosaminyl deacetylase